MSLGKLPDFFLNLSEHEMSRETHRSYRFKSFRLDVGDRRLFHDEVPVQLEPKVFDVLALLVENSGHLVEKDELLRSVWADSFVEETNVARAVYTLRKTLGEDGNGNKFIETVAKKGYRFVAQVTEISEPPAAKPSGENGSSSTSANELPASELAETTYKADLQIFPADDEPRLIAKPKQKTLSILFGIGFPVATGLLLLLAFYFRFESPPNPNNVKSVAVLPVKPINAAARDELYEIGIADSLIHRLSATKSFIVRPLSATRQYTDLAQDPLAAGREQKTDYVLASNYQLADGKIRITAQLFNVASGQIEETYKSEKDASRIFAAQDAIAIELGNILFARLGAVVSNTAANPGTTNEETYRLYFQGKNLTAKRNPSDAKKAIEYFEQAIRLDQNFPAAYSAMAFAYRASGSLGGGLPREQFAKAKEAVNKALELDPNLAEAFAVRGDLKHKYEWDWSGAEKDLLRAIELEPNSDLAHAVYAEILSLHGRFDEALAEKKIALAINPASLVYQRDYGRILYFARRYDEAVEQLERVVELDENFQTAYGWLWLACSMNGDASKAYENFIKQQKYSNPDYVEPLQTAYAAADWQGVMRKHLELQKLDENKPGNSYYQMARFSAMLGEKEQAFEYLNKTIEKGHSQIVMLNVEPGFDSIRADPRYAKLIRRVGFE